MSSDRQQFNAATRRWHGLHEQGAYSLPADAAQTVIAYSDTMDSDTIGNDVFTFQKEAAQFAKRIKRDGGQPEIIHGITGLDMKSILTDPKIATIILIGHGALSFLYMDNGMRRNNVEGKIKELPNDRYDWRNVSEDADHLKRGVFVQRYCGNYVRKLSVPLGTFAVANQSNVIAPVGASFCPTSLYDRIENSRMRYVHDSVCLTYRAVKELFDNNEFIQSTISEPEAGSNTRSTS